MALEKSKILKSAEKYVATGKISQAIEEYEKILKENPKDWIVMIQVGDLYLKVNKTAEAIEYFQKVADHYYADGFFLKAIAIFKRINKIEPNLTVICIKLADLYLKQGLTMDAKSQLQTVAHHYLSKNQSKDAVQTLQKLIEIEPQNLKTRNDLAKTYQKEGMVPEAIKEYLEISDQLTGKNLMKESLAVLETAYKLDPRNTGILRKILSFYSENQEPGKAAVLLEEAVRLDPTNPEVLGMLAESYADHNQFDKAHQTIDRAIQTSPKKEPLWKTKGDICLKSGDLEGTFFQYSQVVDRLVQRKEPVEGVELLQKITRADSSFFKAWQRLIDLFSMLRQQSNMIAAHASLVDAFISKAMYEDAALYLEKLIKLEPDDSQHREKLRFVKSFLEKTTPSYKPPEPEKVYEVEAAVPKMPAPEFTARGGLQPEPGVTQPKPQPQPRHVTQPPGAAMPSVASLAVPDEEKEYVSEHLIEAEVFNKYGLIDKAVEQLYQIVSKYPHSVATRQKLKEIYLEKGERDKAVEECVHMSRIFRKYGDSDQAEDLLSEARQINPNHPALEKAFKEFPSPAKAADVMGEIEKLAQSIKTKSGSFRIQRPSVKPPAPTPPSSSVPIPSDFGMEIELEKPERVRIEPPAPLVEHLPESTFEEIDFYSGQGLITEARDLLNLLKERHPDDPVVLSRLARLEGEVLPKAVEYMQEEAPEPVFVEEEVSISLGEEIPISVEEALDLAAIEPSVETPSQEARAAESEIEIPGLHIESEAVMEEIQILEEESISGEEEKEEFSISLESEESEGVVQPTIDLADLVSLTSSEGPGEEREPEELVVEVVEEPEEIQVATTDQHLEPTVFAELEDEEVAVREPFAEVNISQAVEAAVTGEDIEKEEGQQPAVIRTSEELFEEEADFFDLAAEMEEGLLSVQSAVEEEKPADGQNYSIEQILIDFKKGVEKQLGAEDYDTRYNLGIAYKEMGLIDEAIAEFQIAAKDPNRLLECCSMLGLCFVEKGMPKLAVKWYQRGLEKEGYSEDEYEGLRFDMAQAHESAGDLAEALEAYQEVYGVNANYRNVAKKVKELQEQLKNK